MSTTTHRNRFRIATGDCSDLLQSAGQAGPVPLTVVALFVLMLMVLPTSPAVAGPYSDAVIASSPVAYYRLDETTGITATNTGTGVGINATYVNVGTDLNPSQIGQPGPQLGGNVGAFLIDGFEANNRSLLLSPTVGSAAATNTFPRAEVSVPDDSATSPLVITGGFTIEAWMKHSGDTVDPGNHEGIAGRYRQDQNGVARSYVLYYDSTAETTAGVGPGLGIAFSPDGAFSASNSVEFLGPITVGEWAHVAAVFEPGVRMELYVNGESIGEVNGVISTPLYSGEGDFWIGQQFTGADEWSFQGNLDEVAIYNRALSDTEIGAHFAAATDSTPIFFSWDQNTSGDWNTAANWTLDTIPNTNERIAIFGGAISSPKVVYSNAAITVKGLRFANTNSYAVAGTGTITLAANSGNASIDVVQGAHEIQAAVTLGSNTDVDATGGSVDFNNVLNLGTRTLSIEAGRVNINHSVVAGAGGTVVNAGTLGTAGATAFGGNFTSTGTLHVDLAGTGTNEFDAFQISGTATLSGLLDAELVNGFTLSGNESFTVLTAGSLVNNGIALTTAADSLFNLMVVGNSLVLTASLGLTGDYNNNGVVDAADYIVWRDTLGSNSDLRANGDNSGPSAGVIDQADYIAWRANFGRAGAAASGAVTAAVPEPSAAALLVAALVSLAGVRRQRALAGLNARICFAATLLSVGWFSVESSAGPYSDAVLADNPLVYYRLEETAGSFIATNAGTGGFALDGFYNQFSEASGPRSQAQPGPRPGDLVGGFPIDGLEAGNLASHWGPAPADYTRVQVDDTDALDISTTGLTLEAWVNRDAQTDAGANEGIIGKYLGTGNQRSYNLYYDPTPGVIGMALSSNGANQTAFTLQTTTNIPQGEWTHIAATWVPGQSMHIYFNGQQVATRTLEATQTAIHVGTAPLWIGQQFNTAAGSTFEGLIDEPAIYDRALSAAEILEHFQAATGAFLTTYTWNVNGSGDWNTPANWAPASAPNNNMAAVIFGSAISSPQTVTLESDVTAKSIQFNNANKYAVAGPGTIILAAESGHASITVAQGNHEFQTPIRLTSDTDVSVTSGSLSFNNELDLNGHTLDILAGTVNIRHSVLPGPGGIVSNAATLAMEGAASIGGDFVNSGTLEFSITGAGQHDSLSVVGTAALSGLLYAAPAAGYLPAAGDSFTLLSAGALVDEGISLTGPLASRMHLNVVGNSLILSTVAVPESASLLLLTIAASLFTALSRSHRKRCK